MGGEESFMKEVVDKEQWVKEPWLKQDIYTRLEMQSRKRF